MNAKIKDYGFGGRHDFSRRFITPGRHAYSFIGADIDRHLLKVIQNYISCYSENPFPKEIKVMIPVA